MGIFTQQTRWRFLCAIILFSYQQYKGASIRPMRKNPVFLLALVASLGFGVIVGRYVGGVMEERVFAQLICGDLFCDPGEECWEDCDNCNDSTDNDSDLDTDCADSDCTSDPLCEYPEATCDDGFDNDGDGLMDCTDTVDCSADPACSGGDPEPAASNPLSPADNATGIAVDANLVINFDENVDPESVAGLSDNITIKKTSDNSTFEAIEATSGNVTGGGTSSITINPTSDFTNSIEYYVLIGADAFDDTAGNSYAGISSTTTWSYTIVAAGGGGGTCDNDGTTDAGETCSNCPYDKRCDIDEKCIAGACSGTDWECKREEICGDGWVSGSEECDDGGICTGSSIYSGMDCMSIDMGDGGRAGVARCRVTGGICVAQDGDGCSADCLDRCAPVGDPCLIDADCCTGDSCTNGLCGVGSVIDGDCDDGGGTCPGGCTTSGDSWSFTTSVPSAPCEGGAMDCIEFDGLSSLTYMNGGWCENEMGSGCTWCWGKGAVGAVCGAPSDQWMLYYDSALSKWTLDVSTIATYSIDEASWNCTGPNVLNVSDGPHDCIGYLPASITVTPTGLRECNTY
jgi:hypothetical protein